MKKSIGYFMTIAIKQFEKDNLKLGYELRNVFAWEWGKSFMIIHIECNDLRTNTYATIDYKIYDNGVLEFISGDVPELEDNVKEDK